MGPTPYVPNTERTTLGGFPFWKMMEEFKESIERLAMDQQDAFHQRVHFRQQNPSDPLSGQVPIPVPPNPTPPPEAPATTATTPTAPPTATTPTATANPETTSATTPNTTTTYTGYLEPGEYEVSPEEMRWQWMLAPPEPTPAKRRKEDPEPTAVWEFPASSSNPMAKATAIAASQMPANTRFIQPPAAPTPGAPRAASTGAASMAPTAKATPPAHTTPPKPSRPPPPKAQRNTRTKATSSS